MAAPTAEIRHRSVAANGITVHVAEAGPEAGPAVLFVHGFPELWYSWRHQMEKLKRDVPMLEEVVVIKGAGHFIQQEISDHIYDYIKKFDTGLSTPKLSKL